MFAGGNPWKVNETLQSGRPTQIGELAQAFHNAGQSTQEAEQHSPRRAADSMRGSATTVSIRSPHRPKCSERSPR
jgi:hypothetical protein